MAKYAIDISPLKKSKDFSLLWAAGLISYFGSMITYVAVPFQIKELTNSYVAVAVSGLVEIVPLVIFGLYGGVLADSLDRKKLIWVTESLSLIFTGALLVNSLMDSPSLILIYIVSGLFAATSGLRQPAMQAALPRLVDHEDMPPCATGRGGGGRGQGSGPRIRSNNKNRCIISLRVFYGNGSIDADEEPCRSASRGYIYRYPPPSGYI